MKKLTVSSYEKLDQALILWFTQERQKGIVISSPLIKEKALQLNKLMDGDPSFSVSCGFFFWIVGRKDMELDSSRLLG